jgi:small subunit ribosomal protein S15
MARIHSHRHGKSHQTRPTSKRAPSWLTYSADEVVALVIKLAKDGRTPGQIGVILRDEYGIPLAKQVTGKSILEIMKENKVVTGLPDDLQNLLSRAQRVQRHLELFKADRKNVRSLELVEAKIYRLSEYYKEIGSVPSDFKYKAVIAQLT